jgi:hypothetical protein
MFSQKSKPSDGVTIQVFYVSLVVGDPNLGSYKRYLDVSPGWKEELPRMSFQGLTDASVLRTRAASWDLHAHPTLLILEYVSSALQILISKTQSHLNGLKMKTFTAKSHPTK